MLAYSPVHGDSELRKLSLWGKTAVDKCFNKSLERRMDGQIDRWKNEGIERQE